METVVGIIALVGSGTRDGWSEMLVLFGGAIGLVAISLAGVWLVGGRTPMVGGQHRGASSDGTDPNSSKRLPFIPSSW